MGWVKKLSGYKTYITGVAAILTAIGAYLSHTIALDVMIGSIFVAIQTMNIRSGISTDANKVSLNATGKEIDEAPEAKK